MAKFFEGEFEETTPKVNSLKAEVEDVLTAYRGWADRRNELAHGYVTEARSPDYSVDDQPIVRNFALLPSHGRERKWINREPEYNYIAAEIEIFANEFEALDKRVEVLASAISKLKKGKPRSHLHVDPRPGSCSFQPCTSIISSGIAPTSRTAAVISPSGWTPLPPMAACIRAKAPPIGPALPFRHHLFGNWLRPFPAGKRAGPGNSGLKGHGLYHWAVGDVDLTALRHRVQAAGFTGGDLVEGGRTLPNGKWLGWEMFRPPRPSLRSTRTLLH